MSVQCSRLSFDEPPAKGLFAPTHAAAWLLCFRLCAVKDGLSSENRWLTEPLLENQRSVQALQQQVRRVTRSIVGEKVMLVRKIPGFLWRLFFFFFNSESDKLPAVKTCYKRYLASWFHYIYNLRRQIAGYVTG